MDQSDLSTGPQCSVQRGFTLLELALVVSIVSFLAVLAIGKIWELRKDAERAAVAQVVGALRSALGLEVASHYVRGGLHKLPELAGSNPMELLAQRPPGYVGEMAGADPSVFSGGQWYFDAGDGTLNYTVRFSDSFNTMNEQSRLRFHVVLRYRDVNESGVFEAGIDEVSSLDLQALESYR